MTEFMQYADATFLSSRQSEATKDLLTGWHQ